MSAFDEFKSASFDGIDFPWQELSIRGGVRDHIHEYPHSPGGLPEKLGRKLYEIEFSSVFMNTMRDPKWHDLWPTSLAVLRGKFEREITSDLYIPTIGTIRAYATEWDQKANGKLRSGETVSFKFREDQSDDFLTSELIKVSPQSVDQRMTTLTQEAEAKDLVSLFDGVQMAVDGVLAVLDQADLGVALLEAKLLQLEAICRDLDRRQDALNDPENHRILEALKALWASAVDLRTNAKSSQQNLRSYVVPVEMTITDVAGAVFGDASRSVDILKLNPIEDAFAIPAGTELRYYEAA